MRNIDPRIRDLNHLQLTYELASEIDNHSQIIREHDLALTELQLALTQFKLDTSSQGSTKDQIELLGSTEKLLTEVIELKEQVRQLKKEVDLKRNRLRNSVGYLEQ